MHDAFTPATTPAVLAAAAQRYSNTIAVVDREKVTFSELYVRVRRAALLLKQLGVGKSDRVALWAPNSLNWIVACLGAQCLGAVVVPINTRLKGREAQFVLNKSRACILLTVENFLAINYRELLAGLELPHLRHTITFESQWPVLLQAIDESVYSDSIDTDTVQPNDPSDILFTSGTTGEPKGVVSSHRQTVEVFKLWSQRVGVRAGDRYLIVNPFFHSFGYKAGWLACLLTGATAYPLATLDIAALIETVTREQITVLPGPPTLFQTLLATDLANRIDLSSIRLSITGAAVVPLALIERMRNELRIAHVLTGYGLTECGVATVSDASDSAMTVATTAGKPLPGIEVICVDQEGEEVPRGQSGEIWIRGFNVMLGYFEDPIATAAVIDEKGWLHSGDIGRFDSDGNLQITDRLKDMYITGGFNVYPAEVENILCRHPSVAQAIVIGVADSRLGEVGEAFIVLRNNSRIEADSLVAWSRENMANYKVPRVIRIVDALPTNAAGKVQKFLLRNS
jgi:HIP---CoA ligase